MKIHPCPICGRARDTHRGDLCTACPTMFARGDDVYCLPRASARASGFHTHVRLCRTCNRNLRDQYIRNRLQTVLCR